MAGGRANILTRGGIYLARLDPAKGAEIGKLRPVVVLTHQTLLDVRPAHVFVCPLSSRSDPAYKALHLALEPRDSLQVTSYALVEHCRSISIQRIKSERLAQLDTTEIDSIVHKLQQLIGA
jgi:mRNA interferase MazF